MTEIMYKIIIAALGGIAAVAILGIAEQIFDKQLCKAFKKIEKDSAVSEQSLKNSVQNGNEEHLYYIQMFEKCQANSVKAGEKVC